MAGVAAVEAILKTKNQADITIFGDESYTNYNRILLSDVLAGKTSFEKIVLNTQEWYTDNGIDLRLGVSVNAIDPVSKSVIDANGQATPYDSLVLAMGGLPYLPPILGSDKRGVMVFRTMDETKEIVRLARESTEAVVIGGGLLGLEAARGLMNYGVSVSVVHLSDRLMEQQLDDVGASLLKREIERMGIRIILNATAKEIVGEEVSGVVLTTGETIPCNMVLICAGIRPNLTLTKTAGIFVNRGVLVNDQMRTNVPDIFAVGDLIEHREKTYGLVAPLKDQAAVVADAIMGEGKKMYHGTVCATTLKVAGVSVTSAGNFYGGGISEAISFLDSEKGIYKKCVFTRNRLEGFILLGDNKDSTRLFNLIAKGEEIKNKGALLGNLSIECGELPSSGVFAMADSEFVCNCNSVTKGEIITAIREKGLKTREQVATCTLAGTGCGSCTQLVDDLLIGPQSITASAITVSVALINNPSSYQGGVEALKTLDLEKVKQDGLGIDFERLKRDGARGISVEDRYRLKTYGFCAQKHPGYFMLRHRIPGGVLTSSQLAHLAGLCETYGRNKAHITVRQNLELHWVRVEDALDIFEKLRNIGITTRSSCGHTLRNVVACPHGTVAPEGLLDVAPWAARVSDYYVSQSALINPTMPNRINVYFSSCHACNADAVLNDIAFVAVSREVNGIQAQCASQGTVPLREIGFELWVGGSLGTHPMLAFKIRDFIPVADSLPACIAIFEIHTKFGDRAKARSRLKYLIQQWGREKFVAMFDRLFLEKKSLPENLALPAITENKQTPNQVARFFASIFSSFHSANESCPNRRGTVPQRQRGYVRLVVDVPVGEISAEQLAAVGKIAEKLGDGRVHFTKNQNLELHWIRVGQIKRATRLLNRVALYLKGEANILNVLACPGTEFCPLAITNAFGAARDVLKSFHPDHSEKAALLKSISIHISGCPNSCARHQVGDIGLAGTLVAVGDLRWYSYQLFLGGTMEGGIILGEMVRKGITDNMIVPTIDGLLDVVLEQRKPGETFQAVMTRLTPKEVVVLLEPKLVPYLPEASHEVAMAMGLNVTTSAVEVS